MVFRLDLSQISFNLVKNALASRQLGFLATSNRVLRHFDSGMRRNQNFETFEFLDEKVTYIFRLFDFWNFFLAFPFSHFFPFCCGDWPSTGLACG